MLIYKTCLAIIENQKTVFTQLQKMWLNLHSKSDVLGSLI